MQVRTTWRQMDANNPQHAVHQALADTADEGVAVTFLFFTPDIAPNLVSSAIAESMQSNGLVLGCSTAGELSPSGFRSGGVAAMSLAAPGLRIGATLISPLSQVDLDAFDHVPGALAKQIGRPFDALVPGRHTFIALFDGLSGQEDLITAYLGRRLHRIGLVGASAGDNLAMETTWVCLNDQVVTDGAVIALLETPNDVSIIHHHHFKPLHTTTRITNIDRSGRIILELDGLPALEQYNRLLGLPPDSLDPQTFDKHPFAIWFRGQWMLCSVMRAHGQHLRVARAAGLDAEMMLMAPGDLVKETHAAVKEMTQTMGRTPEAMLLFHCVSRSALAESDNLLGPMFDALNIAPLTGFNSYGEQLGTLHLNHTLTGIAF